MPLVIEDRESNCLTYYYRLRAKSFFASRTTTQRATLDLFPRMALLCLDYLLVVTSVFLVVKQVTLVYFLDFDFLDRGRND